jgi:hypothetical protein
LVAVLLTAGAVGAHDIWITTVHEGSGEMRALVHYGPPGDRRPPIEAKMFAFGLLGNDQAWRSLLPGLTSDVHEGMPVLVSTPFAPPRDMGPWLLAACYDHGYVSVHLLSYSVTGGQASPLYMYVRQI